MRPRSATCTKLNLRLLFVHERFNKKAEPWDLLFETAETPKRATSPPGQAAEAGFSSQLLLNHIRAGRVTRTRRGIYRLVHFPAGEHEELVVAWLWSYRAGVVSHADRAVAPRALGRASGACPSDPAASLAKPPAQDS